MQATETKLTRPLLLLVFLLALTYYAAENTPLFGDSDPAWHIMAGHQILEMGHIPEFDSWSYEAGKTKWYNLSWAFDIALSKAYDLMGLEGLKVLWMLLGSILMTLLAYACLMAGAAWFVIIPVICLALTNSFESMCIRPQMVTFYMCLIFYITLYKLRDRTAKKAIYLLPPLMIVWVNCHGAFLAGFTILGAFIADCIYRNDKKGAQFLLFLSVACAAAIIVNPYYFEIYTGFRKTFGAASSKYISEWRAAVMPGDIGITLYFLAFLVSAKFISPQIPLAEKLLGIFWLTAGISSFRHFHIAILLATPFLALSLSEVVASHRKDMTKDHILEFLGNRRSPTILASLIVIIIASLVLPYTRTTLWNIEPGFRKSLRVGDELAFIEKNYPKLNMLNDYDFGGNIIFESEGRKKVFIDGRSETAYSTEYVTDYFKISGATAYTDDLLKKYAVELMWLQKKTLLLNYIKTKPEWVKVFEGHNSMIFVRKDKAITPAVP